MGVKQRSIETGDYWDWRVGVNAVLRWTRNGSDKDDGVAAGREVERLGKKEWRRNARMGYDYNKCFDGRWRKMWERR